MVMLQQLVAEVAFVRRVPVIRSVKCREVIANINMVSLDRVRQPLHVDDDLIELQTIGVCVVRFRRIAV